MITGPTFGTFQDAYLAVLSEIFHRAEYSTATRGKTAIETTNVSFTIANPIARTPYLAARKTNIVFNHAEALWYLSGRDDLDMIAYYAPSLRSLSVDGLRLTGTAYGPRLFAPDGDDGRSQFDRVIQLLQTDPDAKRAAMPVMRPDELVDPSNPDVACTLGLQFMLRGGRLNLSAFMRGNDTMIGLLGDSFAFTFIQELAACLLGVSVGTYAHHVGSMHINVLDLPKVEKMLADQSSPSFPAGRMPSATGWPVLRQILAWEENLRLNRWQVSRTGLDQLPADVYWREVVMLFEVYRQIIHQPDRPITEEALAALRPGHRWLIERRWPSRIPGR